jgi:cytochrome c biogenesis protein CcmG, thiol:disulfide interchange protein DsbE
MPMPYTIRRSRHAGLLVKSCGIAMIALTAGCDRDNRPDQIGKPAPEFAINDGQRSVDLGKYRGQVVVLNFWASWCAPCIEEMPSLELMQRELPQVQVLAVDGYEDFGDYQRFIAARHVSLLTVFDQAHTSNELYGSFRFPETYIIDKKGFVRRKLIGPQDFTSPDIVDYLKKLAA